MICIYNTLVKQTLTPRSVHKAIQDIDTAMVGYDHSINVSAIEDVLHVAPGDLSVYIKTLGDLNYINFANRASNKISLTNNGRYTVVPQ